MPPILYLIDGHALAYRTFFAITKGSSGGFITRSGETTAGVFGFASVLLRLLEQEQPEFLAVAFDTGRTFRDDLFPAYKGTRAKMPTELASQIERIRQLVDAFNIPRLEVEGYEADDVLGSLAQQAVAQGMGVKIMTGDRDLLQLVSERVIVSLPGKSLSDSRDYLPADVIEAFGVRPDQVVDFKALVGDKSDNIPGVAGVGEKTAANLLTTYETLEGVYQHLDELTASVRTKLEKDRDNAFLSRTLATIVQDLVVPLDLTQARVDQFDPAQAEAIFRELEFRTLLPRLIALETSYGKRAALSAAPSAAPSGAQLTMFTVAPTFQGTPPPPDPTCEVTVVDTPEALAALAARLAQAEVISFDTETTSTDQMQAELVGISLAVEPHAGYYLPVGHLTGERQLPLDEVLAALRGPLTDPRIPKVGHNVKYDFVMLARAGLRIDPLGFDSMIAEWVINPNSRNLGLKNLAWVRQDIHMTHIQELIGKGKKQITMAEVPVAAAAPYAVADAEVVLRLMPELERELEECNGAELFRTIEMPLVCVLADMEMAGISLDVPFLHAMAAELQTRMLTIEDEIYTAVGGPFNLNSPQQLSDALFNRLALAPPDRTARTASGHYSTAASILEAMRGKHPVLDAVLEYRELSKLKSTYVDALPLQVNPRTGRIHTSFNQTSVVTGRIASTDPNLQNIPTRSELGQQVRHAFVAGPGKQLIAVDYSQVELRVVAHMSGDKAMTAAFLADQDIHATTAAAIYHVPLAEVTKDMRRRAKGINFGLVYGMSAFGLTRYTDLTLAEAENFLVTYFEQFPGVKSYLDGIRVIAAEQGYVETLLGRRRYFPALKTMTDRNTRNREEREAINAPIQGTAADILKLAMLRLPEALRQAGLSASILLQVHDELVLEAPEAEVLATARLVQTVMENAYKLSVPLKTEARIGRNWGVLTPLGA
jgi:DNA polymerase-1